MRKVAWIVSPVELTVWTLLAFTWVRKNMYDAST